jgi:energy-converting hydrogenase Eha subunit E
MTQDFIVNFIGVITVMAVASIILIRGIIWVKNLNPKEVKQ